MRKFFHIHSLLLLAGLFIYGSCSSKVSDNDIPRLTNKQFIKEVKKPNTIIVDVRTPDEFKEGHIEGAMLIDYLDTENFIKKILTLDTSKNYILYCRTGVRSMNAASIMQSKGFKKVSDLKDGFSKWDGPIVSSKK